MFRKTRNYIKYLFCTLFVVSFFFSVIACAKEKELIRITGGPVFFDEFNNSQLDKNKWSLWDVDFDDKKYFSYKTGQNGISLQSTMNCFNGFNFYGIVSKPIRGLTDISLVAEVDVSHETKFLPAIVHLCNCCNKFSDIGNDDFWCEVDINKDAQLHFHCNEIKKFNELGSKYKTMPNKFQTSGLGKYIVKITQTSPSYKIKGYIRPNKKDSKYILVGSTDHPYPISQAKIELKTYTVNCDEKNELKNPYQIATFRNIRIYKNPNRNPLFVRVINKEGVGIPDYKVEFTAKDPSGKSFLISNITDQDGYASLDLSKLLIQEYPIFDYDIKVLKSTALVPIAVFNKNFKTNSLKEGIYPGDFWQVYCASCN